MNSSVFNDKYRLAKQADYNQIFDNVKNYIEKNKTDIREDCLKYEEIKNELKKCF